jgi:RNase P/RNase MRP subunit p29
MPWPDIFFPRAKKTQPVADSTPPASTPTPETPAPVAAESAPATALPPTLPGSPQPIAPQPLLSGDKFSAEQKKLEPVIPAKPSLDRSTRTIPAMHGVVLRGPGSATKSVPATPPAPLKNIEQLMAEADPVRALSQTGSIRLLKRSASDAVQLKGTGSAATETGGLPSVSAASLPTTQTPPPKTIAPMGVPVPPQPRISGPIPEAKKVDPIPVIRKGSVAAPADDEDDSPFILKPTVSTEPKETVQPPAAPEPEPTPAPAAPAASETTKSRSLFPFSIFPRKRKMADVARIVLPPKREDVDHTPPAPAEPAPTVVPPAFPVTAMTARVNKPISENNEPEKFVTGIVTPPPFPGTLITDEKPVEVKPAEVISTPETLPIAPTSLKTETVNEPEIFAPSKPLPSVDSSPAPNAPEKMVFDTLPIPDLQPITPPTDIPKVDPEAHKPDAFDASLPKIDPEAHKPTPPPAPAQVGETLSTLAPKAEKREFHLTNGEKVVGVVLSETPEAVYLEHASLGVLTVPRAQIAKRLVEIILINGDRIVGDIMAETADTLYVRHSSLGMLTVPRSHRSTRVVEAVLTDGDRILGEILTETDSFTVIRSATLGTVTVPHNKISMLNRKIEQVELKALPPAAPELKDKPAN